MLEFAIGRGRGDGVYMLEPIGNFEDFPRTCDGKDWVSLAAAHAAGITCPETALVKKAKGTRFSTKDRCEK